MSKEFSQEEEYIISENREVYFQQISEKFFKIFPAFKHRNFKLFFAGQFLSLIGTWMQTVAQGWLVFELTRSAYMVGIIAALGSLPVLIFSLFGGVIVDRYPKKTILIITQALEMILAFILAFLTISGSITIAHIAILSFILGIVVAVDMPARQAFVIEMVGRSELSSAIALNAATYNGARIFGPALAGVIIAIFGTGFAFLINGMSFVAVIIALLFISVASELPRSHPNPLKAIKNGIAYTLSHPALKTLMLFAAISSIFGWSHATIMPVIVKEQFASGAQMLGYFFSAQGVGAVSATIIASHYSKKIIPPVLAIYGGIIFSIGIVLFTATSSAIMAMPFLFISGLGIILQFSMLNASIQHMVEDSFRGRVMSIYSLMFLGMMPIGNYLIGFIAEHTSSAVSIQTGAAVVFIVSLFLIFKKRKLAKAYSEHIENLPHTAFSDIKSGAG